MVNEFGHKTIHCLLCTSIMCCRKCKIAIWQIDINRDLVHITCTYQIYSNDKLKGNFLLRIGECSNLYVILNIGWWHKPTLSNPSSPSPPRHTWTFSSDYLKSLYKTYIATQKLPVLYRIYVKIAIKYTWKNG